MRTKKETEKVAGEQAQVEIRGGGETIKQGRDGVQDEHRYGAGQRAADQVATIPAPAV